MDEGPDLHREPEAAADMAVNAVRSYLHSCGIESREEKRKWIKEVCGRIADLALED